MNKLIALGFVPRSLDAGLLILRLWFGISLFVNHGLMKVRHFSQMSAHFMDPLHIGTQTSLLLAILGEIVCSALIVLGLAARWAALYVIVELGIAFTLIHHMKLQGQGNGELAFLYIGAALVVLIAGPGRFSLDRA